jgi:hypothetical protein
MDGILLINLIRPFLTAPIVILQVEQGPRVPYIFLGPQGDAGISPLNAVSAE